MRRFGGAYFSRRIGAWCRNRHACGTQNCLRRNISRDAYGNRLQPGRRQVRHGTVGFPAKNERHRSRPERFCDFLPETREFCQCRCGVQIRHMDIHGLKSGRFLAAKILATAVSGSVRPKPPDGFGWKRDQPAVFQAFTRLCDVVWRCGTIFCASNEFRIAPAGFTGVRIPSNNARCRPRREEPRDRRPCPFRCRSITRVYIRFALNTRQGELPATVPLIFRPWIASIFSSPCDLLGTTSRLRQDIHAEIGFRAPSFRVARPYRAAGGRAYRWRAPSLPP